VPPARLAHRPLARLTGTASAVALALTGLSGPASAQEPEIWLDSYVGASAVTIGSTGKTVPVWYRATAVGGAVLPKTITARIDSSAASNVRIGLAQPAPGCAASGTTVTCQRTPGDTFAPDGDLRIVVRAASGAKAGDTGELRITVTADDTEPSLRIFPITVAAPGPDLGRWRCGPRSGTTATAPPGPC
jgi:hypothetical protein